MKFNYAILKLNLNNIWYRKLFEVDMKYFFLRCSRQKRDENE